MPRKAKKEAVKETNKKAEAKKQGTWYRTGEEGMAYKRQMDTARKLQQEKGVRRLRLTAGEEATIVFVDSSPYFINEHNLEIAGRWGNFFTCIKDYGECPICDSGHRPTYTAYYTIIDTREYTIKNGPNAGKVLKNQKMLFPAKGSAMEVLDTLHKKLGSLAGMAFKVKRISKDDPNCGRDFEKLRKVTLTGDNAKPFDYRKVLAPPTTEELASLGHAPSTVVGSDDDVNDSGKGSGLEGLV